MFRDVMGVFLALEVELRMLVVCVGMEKSLDAIHKRRSIYIYIARDEQTDLNKRSYELCWQHQEARMTNNHEVAT